MKTKIKISSENGEIVIEGNKEGLRHLSEICQRLSNLSDAEANTPSNHYHISADMNNAEKDSLPTVIVYNNEL